MIYEIIEFLTNNRLDEVDIQKAIDNIRIIENKDKDNIIDSRNLIQENSSILFKTFNEYILNMNDVKNPNFYKDVDVSKILGVSVVTVKNWRRNGRLKYEQTGKGCGVKISRNSIDMFIRENPKYIRKWKTNKIK